MDRLYRVIEHTFGRGFVQALVRSIASSTARVFGLRRLNAVDDADAIRARSFQNQ
jgi:hypothetical protein